MPMIRSSCNAVAAIALGFLAGNASGQGSPFPKYYQETGLQPFRSGVSTRLDEHVDPFTGRLQLHHVDGVLPGAGGFDLTLQRSYNSPMTGYASTSDGLSYNRTPNVGVGWSLLIGGRLFVGQACSGAVIHQMVFETPDGGRQAFIRTGVGASDFLSASRWRAVCTAESSEGATVVHVYSPNGVRYRMAKPIAETIPNTAYAYSVMYPTEIRDANDNTATLTYTSGLTPLLSSISTSDGRSISLSYLTYGRLQLLDRISTDLGPWTFGYTVALNDTQGFGVAYQLTRVAPPSGGVWTYAYNSCTTAGAGSCGMNRITYPQGGSINYGYTTVNFGDGTGFVSAIASKTGSTGSWSFAYTPGSGSVHDRTVVNSPLGTLAYKHVGYGNVGPGTTWKAGLLMERTTGSAQTETFTWDRQQISSYPTDRGYVNLNDGVTYAPLLTNRTITRSGAPYATTYSNFDGYGNPGTIAESGQRARTISRFYCVNTTKWVVNKPGTEIISGAGTIGRGFDANCNQTSETRFGVNTSYGRTSAGDMSSRTDDNGRTTSYLSYYRGVPQTESRPDGSSMSRTVSSAGNVTQQSDGAGNSHGYGFDGLRRPTSWNPPAGASMSISWSGSTSRSGTRGGYSEQASYDSVGNPASVTRGGIGRDFDHDDFQHLTFESLPGVAGGTSLSRDILGRVTQMTHVDATSRTLGYSGNTVQVTDERAKQTTYRYQSYGDPDHRYLVGIDLPNGQNISIGRDAVGNMTSVTQGGVTRTYAYNSKYFLINVNDPETGSTAYERDAVGNMTSMTVGGRKTSYQYDAMNRLTRISYPDGEIINMTYYGDGRARRVSNSKATIDYEYDANRNLTKETLAVDGFTFITQYAYTSIDALSSITYPRTGEVVDYAPNSLARPTRVGSYVTTVGHRNSGNLSSMSFANGVSMSFAETGRQWPSSVRATKAGDIVNKAYGFDSSGNVRSITDGVNAANSLTLSYDDVNRLTSASGPWGTGSLSYDAVGNLTSYSLGGVSRSYGYAAGNRLTSFEGRSFSYDGYGNVTGDGLHAYAYSDAPNLTCVDCLAAGRIEYGYDGNNRRVWRKQYGVTTYYVHAANGDLLLEYTPSSGVTLQHVYLKGQRVATKSIAP